MYESTGLYKESTVQIIHPDSGQVIKKVYLPDTFFGEGLAVHDDKVYVLTWKEKTLFIYDSVDLEVA